MTGPGVARGSRALARQLGLALLMTLPPVAGAAAASPSPRHDVDRLAASLLSSEDLPGHVPSGVMTETDLDIDRAAFEEQGGVGFVEQVWVSQEQGVVFDDRMLFPSPEAALAYLEAAEPTLSEAADAGLALVRDDPPLTGATRHWSGDATIGDQRVAMDVWLVPVGPVAAKVAVTTFGAGLETRRAIAERALARIEAQYGPPSARWPAPSSSPMMSAGASPPGPMAPSVPPAASAPSSPSPPRASASPAS